MTSNQKRAIALAHGIIENWAAPHEVDDADWHLLLLAAGMNNCRSLPRTVAARVLHLSECGAGYFTAAGHARRESCVEAGVGMDVSITGQRGLSWSHGEGLFSRTC